MKNLKKTIYSAGIFLFLFTTSIFADELTEIINAILEKGARWKAGITSVSILSHEERKNLLGGGKTLFPPEDRKISPPIKKCIHSLLTGGITMERIILHLSRTRVPAVPAGHLVHLEHSRQ